MDNSVYWMLEVSINSGKLEEWKSLMNEMVEATKANEPGALNYEWSINETNDACHIYERYKDSEALLIHLGNFGKNFAERFTSIVKIEKFTYYGNANEKVQEALNGFGAKFMRQFGGFIR